MEILKKLEIKYRNISLYETAFTHSSYANENAIESYERLEFLGDKVIDLIISEYLYINRNIQEGEMTKIRAAYVCETALYEYALKLNFQDYIKLGKGELHTKGNYKQSILADVFEAFIAALYLDLGINEAKRFVKKIIIKNIEDSNEYFCDYKSMLQELVQIDKKSTDYKVVKEEGPSHEKHYEVIVKVGNITFGRGIGNTKKEAEQNAAKDALDKQA